MGAIKVLQSSMKQELSEDKNKQWAHYQFNSFGRKPNEFLVKFCKEHKSEIKNGKIQTATEVCFGSLSDTLYMAKQGLKVFGTDGVIIPQLVNSLNKNLFIKGSVKDNITLQQQNLTNLNLPKSDLVYSMASLGFCPEKDFANMIMNIIGSVNPNGYVALHFFDKNHAFTKGPNGVQGFTNEQLTKLFNYMGFKPNIEGFINEKFANGEIPPPQFAQNYFVTAQAPENIQEILAGVDLDKINEILGLCQKQTNDGKEQNENSKQEIADATKEQTPIGQEQQLGEKGQDDNLQADASANADVVTLNQNEQNLNQLNVAQTEQVANGQELSVDGFEKVKADDPTNLAELAKFEKLNAENGQFEICQ